MHSAPRFLNTLHGNSTVRPATLGAEDHGAKLGCRVSTALCRSSIGTWQFYISKTSFILHPCDKHVIIPSLDLTFLTVHRNAGPLSYWTVSNIPLFLLAAPQLYIFFTSSAALLQLKASSSSSYSSSSSHLSPRNFNSILRRAAIPQLLLATLALFVYHVQIITRLASGYPAWYWWIAESLIDAVQDESIGGFVESRGSVDASEGSQRGRKKVADVHDKGPQDKTSPKGFKTWKISGDVVVRWMVIYGIVQGGLFASFLPPA